MAEKRKRPPASEKQLAQIKAYDQKYARYIRMKFNTKYDADVIDWLEKQPSMQGAIKALVRAAIAQGK